MASHRQIGIGRPAAAKPWLGTARGLQAWLGHCLEDARAKRWAIADQFYLFPRMVEEKLVVV